MFKLFWLIFYDKGVNGKLREKKHTQVNIRDVK